MKLKELLRDLSPEAIDGPLDVDVAEVREDSRLVRPGDLFVAVPGTCIDATSFVADAARRGAVAVVAQKPIAAEAFPGTRVRVASAREAIGYIAARRFGEPARAMRMVGVTGTNGKTTTTFLVESILKAAGKRPGVVGTVNYRYDGVVKEAPLTTPGPLELHAILAEMRGAGCTHCVMEASSHALALDRLAGVTFRVAAFTNLTQDHLDFHPSMQAYFEAKTLLVRRHLNPNEGVGVVFVDGEYGDRMASAVVGERLIVSLERDGADVHALRSTCTIDGIAATLSSPLGPIDVRSPLVGRYNLANIAVAAGIALALGLDVPAIQRGIAALQGVPGRVERVPTGERGFAIVVDYAHSPDALENVIAALRPLTRGRLITVFGCGGDRDRGKRPKMGAVVARDADLAIVTSDNPRTEEPRSIVDMILEGVRPVGTRELARHELAAAHKGFFVDVDRRDAIHAAVAAAQQGDVVLIAGKGHEDYQIVGKTKHPFDDRKVAAEALR